jgi:hypothetical protein
MIMVETVGFCASLAVLASFCMTTILPLRLFALTSNVLFIWYGLIGHVYPVLWLHVVLLPVNLVKLYRLQARERSGDVPSSFYLRQR